MSGIETTIWETEIATFLQRLETVQNDLLALLQRKQKLIADADAEAIKVILPEEEKFLRVLEELMRARASILSRAAESDLPSDSLESLARALPKRSPVRHEIQKSIYRTRLIQFQTLTNWVLTQKSLLCVNQMLDLIAGQGKMPPVYNNGKTNEMRGGNGSLMLDRVA